MYKDDISIDWSCICSDEEQYAKFNLRKLKDDFPSIADRIDARLTPPADDT